MSKAQAVCKHSTNLSQQVNSEGGYPVGQYLGGHSWSFREVLGNKAFFNPPPKKTRNV